MGPPRGNVLSARPSRPAGTAIVGADERETTAGSRRLEGIDGSGSDLSRLLSLSDGVFAFALTFLAVTILLPQTTGTPESSLVVYLRRLEPAFVSYVISFLVVASWWSTHHRLFSCIARYDSVLVRLNTLFLLMISVTPFLVSILFVYSPGGFGPGTTSGQLAVAIYAAVQGVGGCDLLAIWRHATRERRLVVPSLSDAWIRTTEHNQLFTIGVFAVSAGLAFVQPLVAELLWFVMVFGVSRRLWRRPRVFRAKREGPSEDPASR